MTLVNLDRFSVRKIVQNLSFFCTLRFEMKTKKIFKNENGNGI
jgi:hypothetical protein